MADERLADLTEDATPSADDWVYATDNGGTVDKKVQLQNLSAVGPQGAQGAVGSQGAIGSQGDTGSQGAKGFQGDVGVQGAKGAQGSQGLQGTTGNQGNQGFQGVIGNQGNQGFQGDAASFVSDVAYNATSWDGVTTIAPSKNAVRDKFEALSALAAGVRTSLNTGVAGQVGVDVGLSVGISGGDTLNGGLAASETLTLGSTSHATQATINIRDQILLISEDKTFSATTARVMIDTPSTRTITLSSGTAAGNQLQALRFAPLVVWGANSPTFSTFFINAQPIFKNDTSVRTINAGTIFAASPTLRADTATLTPGGLTGFSWGPTYDVTNSGTSTVANSIGLQVGGSVGASVTVTTVTGVQVNEIANSGTVTTQIGIDIGALTTGTTNIGFRNASTSVFPQSAKTITATTDTIPATATTIRLNNTSGSSKTLASTPTIADGQAGQVLIITNTSASDVVIQDQGTLASSNLRLGATTRTLSTRDSIILRYDATIADWIELVFSNVL